MVECKYCNEEELYFDKNEKGKFVTMDVNKREPHNCIERQQHLPSYYEDNDGNSFSTTTGVSSGRMVAIVP
jgi:hypothetical protein